jgi:hypothetical protein
MLRVFASPETFAATAIGAPSENDPSVRADPDLPPGIHLRLLPSQALGFPLAPFGIFAVRPDPTELEGNDVLWRDRRGTVVPGRLDDAGGILTADITISVEGGVDVAVEVLGDGFAGRVSLLDRVGDRTLAQRSEPPFIVGGPRVDRLRIEGEGGSLRLVVWRVEPGRTLEQLMGGDPVDRLGLPIDGDRPPWYTAAPGRDAALRRVEGGAPLRLAPPDRPDGPLAPITPDDEIVRVLAHEPALLDACEQMLSDPRSLPSAQVASTSLPASGTRPVQYIDVRIAGSLLAQAMDPGIGRYLGVVDRLDRLPDWERPSAYAAIGLFAFDREARVPDGRRLVDVVGQLDPFVDRVSERYAELVGASGTIADLVAGWDGQRLAVRGLIAVAGAVPPPDPPDVSPPQLGAARWLPGDGVPSSAFRQDFLIPASPLGALVALGRFDGSWATRHETIELPPPADPARRALALLLGRTRERPPLIPAGLVTDAPLEAGRENRYRLAVGDLFGRFGASAELEVPEPPRPGPPTPAPQAKVVLDGPDGDGGPPASPGRVIVEVPVPSVSERTAGSLDIEKLKLSFDGAVVDEEAVPRPAPGQIATSHATIRLPELGVGERRRSTLRAVFLDTAGVESEPAEVTVAYADRRRPPTVETAIGLIWTSRPGPSPEVELKLRWPGGADVIYRVYIADAKSLGIAADSRAAVAAEGGNRDRAHALGGRERFRLLTDPPLKPAGGIVTLSEGLPRALSTVQFLRVVPATAAGREAEFASCPVVAVAVPTDRRPPPPRVRATLVPGGRRAKIAIEAVGLDLAELRASEPGLFTDPPDPAARPPAFRLRRAAGPVPSPLYAREIGRGDLGAQTIDGEPVFVAAFDDPHELSPFVRYSYWAEVRMPPERRVKPGPVENPPAGGVMPVEPAQIADLPRLFSPSSPPATAVDAGAGPPAPLTGATATVKQVAGQHQPALAVASTPSTHPRAIGPYLLRIWEQWGGGEITAAGPEVELRGEPLQWLGTPRPAATATAPLVLHLAVVDPIGRESALTAVEAQ